MATSAKKPAFENFRAGLIAAGKPLLEKDIVPIQARLVAHLDTIRELLVQKSRRHGEKLSLVEITVTWVGMDANPTDVVSIMKRTWSESIFESPESKFWVGSVDDTVLVAFAAKYPEGRYLTGKVLVTF